MDPVVSIPGTSAAVAADLARTIDGDRESAGDGGSHQPFGNPLALRVAVDPWRCDVQAFVLSNEAPTGILRHDADGRDEVHGLRTDPAGEPDDLLCPKYIGRPEVGIG